MEYSLYIDQLVLEFWKGKIDPTDCLILAFIADLDQNNPEIAEHMWKGHFLITRKWLIEQLPILTLGEQAIYKRLRKLRELGILDRKHKTVDGNKTLAYFKLSAFYYKIRNSRHKKADEATEDNKAIVPEDYGSEKSHSLSVSEPWSPETSNESIKDSLEEAEKTAFPDGAVLPPNQDENGRPEWLQFGDRVKEDLKKEREEQSVIEAEREEADELWDSVLKTAEENRQAV